MATTEACTSCSAPAPLVGTVCHYCGGSSFAVPARQAVPAADASHDPSESDGGPGPAAPDDEGQNEGGGPDEARDGASAAGPPLAPDDDLLPASEARRFRGLAVPLVAAAIVAGVGLPLTALAVWRVGRLPDTARASAERFGPPPDSEGRARLTGAATFKGPAIAFGCSSGPPRLMKLTGAGAEYTVLVGVPPDFAAGRYLLQGDSGPFVAVTRVSGELQTWTSRDSPEASGEVVVGSDGSVSAEFRSLRGDGDGGVLDGSIEARCV